MALIVDHFYKYEGLLLFTISFWSFVAHRHIMKALISNRSIVTRFVNLVCSKSVGGQVGLVKEDVPIPAISPDEILVKVKAVALNPTDFKHLDAISPLAPL